ncbi:uncharacterized protein RCC_12200 [Ramularia collo-cygni]|uniref:Uncharacterized protein n=1 Tax=Ramularia collo-cygni TaxID=112498 RepID=A0A2D3ULE7_9PEZI|nr:uncharacterized protein RCC_12200 [Ramularia collo-cygni]CZT14702.1 uncharacterized protein RCC_12200 [Ramularia collo-cygni]
MSPDCDCERCVARRSVGKTPLHLKTYDDSTGPATPPPDPPPRFSYYDEDGICKSDRSKVPDCCCTRCKTRAASRKPPIHLKAFDDTVNLPWHCVCNSDCKAKTCSEKCACTKCGFGRSRCHWICSWNPFTEDDVPRTLRSRHSILYQFESAYNNYPKLVASYGRLDYDTCKSEDLKAFVQQRGLVDPFPPGLTLKSTYIRILDAADRAYRFRFLDLPPEMRNLVYDELLLLRPYGEFNGCHTSILSTCREIYDDASAIIFAINDLKCEFSLDHTTYDGEGVFEVVLNKSPGDYARFCILEADDFFLRATSLRIQITAQRHDTDDNFYYMPISNGLLAFASSFMEGNALIELRIDFSLGSTETVTSIEAHRILWPLRRLRGIKKVEVSGDLSTELAKSIQNDMQSDTSVTNTLFWQRDVKRQANRYLGFDPRYGQEDSKHDFVGLRHQVYTISKELPEIDTRSSPVVGPFFENETQEVEAQKQIRALEALLALIPKDKY